MNTDIIPSMRWTGSMAELVELIYGLDSMKLVNAGEPGIKELLEGFCKVFGMEIKGSPVLQHLCGHQAAEER